MPAPFEIIHPLPEFGAPGVCDTYDEDCLLMTPDQHAACFTGSMAHGIVIDRPDGICPFLD